MQDKNKKLVEAGERLAQALQQLASACEGAAQQMSKLERSLRASLTTKYYPHP